MLWHLGHPQSRALLFSRTFCASKVVVEVVHVRAKDGVGSYGERVAERHLTEAGFTVIDRNWRCDVGEVDLVAFDGDDLVICEVKTRSSDAFGAPLEAVTPVKLRRLWLLAMRYAAAHDVAYRQLRVDAVAVLKQRRGAAIVEHIRGVG